ncbi:ectoderm-neural cortex protein 1-like isoform X1 [Amphiura filiformis]|uniref:ectoderm-neural cortex protein 1-like isoform X1 n=1 Tax=Amphiura filiformis TaxID=82378 RepID=UPI003B217F77
MAARLDRNCHLKKLGNPSYPPLLSSGLNQLRQQSAFCDVTIVVGDQRFPAHKAVLSCASDYFEGMFSSGFQESAMREVTVPGTEDCFAQLLEFAYTGYFTLSVQTAAGILRMANYMMLTDAMKLCAEYLCDVKENLSIDDCFEVWAISCNHDSLSDVAKLYQEHLVQNFPECGRSEVFLENASADILMEMMDNDDIETDTCTEEQILQVVIAWLKYDWEERKVSVAHLLKKARIGLVQVENLKQILGEEILDVPECKDMVEEVIRLNATKDEADVPLIESRPELFASRNTVTGQLTNSCGDLFCKTKSGCYYLNHLNDFPYKYPYLVQNDNGFSYTALVYDSKTIYVACGTIDDDNTHCMFNEDAPIDVQLRHKRWLGEKNFFKFDLESNEWTVQKPMKTVMTSAFLDLYRLSDYIYAVGEDESGDSFVQRYSLVNNEWDRCVPVSVPGRLIDVNDHVLVKGHILFKCHVKDHPGDRVYVLYSVTDNAIYPVRNNRKNCVFDDLDFAFEVDDGGICFFRRYMRIREECLWLLHRVICDFDNSVPSITVETKADVEASVRWNQEDQKEPHRPFLSFNRRKLRMARKAEEHCLCHTGRSQLHVEPTLITILQANAEVDSVASNLPSDTLFNS